MATSKKTTITVVTTERYEVAGNREAHLLAAFVNDTQNPYPDSGSWMISDLPQIGDTKYEVSVDE